MPLHVYRIDREILLSRKLRPIRLNSEKRVVLDYVSKLKVSAGIFSFRFLL